MSTHFLYRQKLKFLHALISNMEESEKNFDERLTPNVKGKGQGHRSRIQKLLLMTDHGQRMTRNKIQDHRSKVKVTEVESPIS